MKMEKKDRIKLSNRNHHLTWFEDTYNEKQYEFAHLYLSAEKLLKEADRLLKEAKSIDANRRENAVHMGVSIAESDAKYSFDAVIAGVPDLVKRIKEMMNKVGAAKCPPS